MQTQTIFSRLRTTLVLAACYVTLVGYAAAVRVSVLPGGGEPNGNSTDIALSEDGRYVAFESSATNLAPSDFNFWGDIFVRDNELGTVELISRSVDGDIGNFWSEDPGITPGWRDQSAPAVVRREYAVVSG